MTKISFVYFDLGGVFFEWDKYFSTAAKTFNVDIKDLVSIFDKYDDSITTGQISPAQFWGYCCQELAIENGEGFDFLTSWVKDYVPIGTTYQFAVEVSKKYPVGLISDIYKGMFPLFMELGIVPNITYSVKALSCEIGLRKPNRAIYEYAQSMAKVDPIEILYIDDAAKNLIVPSELGWCTHQFSTYNPDQSIQQIKHLIII